MSDKSIPFPSHSLFLRSVLFVVYAPAEVTMFLSADITGNRLGASLPNLRIASTCLRSFPLIEKSCSKEVKKSHISATKMAKTC